MNCPPEIAAVLLDILKTGILRIRLLGWSENPGRCAVEADHLHNLPDLLAGFSPDLLKFYWEVGRTTFMDQSSPEDLAQFEPLWKQLQEHVLGGVRPAERSA